MQTWRVDALAVGRPPLRGTCQRNQCRFAFQGGDPTNHLESKPVLLDNISTAFQACVHIAPLKRVQGKWMIQIDRRTHARARTSTVMQVTRKPVFVAGVLKTPPSVFGAPPLAGQDQQFT